MNYLILSFNPRPTDLFNWIYLIHVSFEFVFLASSLHMEKNTQKRAERKSKKTNVVKWITQKIYVL